MNKEGSVSPTMNNEKNIKAYSNQQAKRSRQVNIKDKAKDETDYDTRNNQDF